LESGVRVSATPTRIALFLAICYYPASELLAFHQADPVTTRCPLFILAFALLAPIASAQPVGPTMVLPQPAPVEPMLELIYEEEPFGIADPPIEPEFVGEPDWCDSPYRNGAWRFGFDLIPTELGISSNAFGGWDSVGGTAVRLEIGYERPSGVGVRGQLWAFGEEEIDTGMGDVDFSASTFFLDFYKRLYIEDAELALGGGLAGAHMLFDLPNANQKADFSGGGVSLFGEGFYPLWRWTKNRPRLDCPGTRHVAERRMGGRRQLVN
jgi:hypothetical protein